jgi:hypothetical protein
MWYLKGRADFPEVTDGETPAGSRPHGTCPTPSPVRQGMAGSFALGIGILLLLQLGTDALVLQALLLAALAALILGRFRQALTRNLLIRGSPQLPDMEKERWRAWEDSNPRPAA